MVEKLTIRRTKKSPVTHYFNEGEALSFCNQGDRAHIVPMDPEAPFCGFCEQAELAARPVTDPAGIPALVEAIRHMHGCEATHVGTVEVHERSPTGETVWRGPVEVFALKGHPQATTAYAWSEPTEGEKRRFFAVVEAEPVTGAAQAVQASLLADAK